MALVFLSAICSRRIAKSGGYGVDLAIHTERSGRNENHSPFWYYYFFGTTLFLNSEFRVRARAIWVEAGWHPPDIDG